MPDEAKPARRARKTEQPDAPETTEIVRVEHETLAHALSAFQGDVTTFSKTKTATVETRNGGTYTYTYADLGGILPVVNPLLAKHGLSWSARLGTDSAGDYVLRYILRHVSGESDGDTMPLAVGQGARPQELGSAITYLRRYIMTAQLGLATEEDTDARETESAPRREQRGRRSNGGSGQAKAPAKKPAAKPEHLDDETWSTVRNLLVETRTTTGRLRQMLIGVGMQNVPADPALAMQALAQITPEQATELIGYLNAAIDAQDAPEAPSQAPSEQPAAQAEVAQQEAHEAPDEPMTADEVQVAKDTQRALAQSDALDDAETSAADHLAEQTEADVIAEAREQLALENGGEA